ncbi:hypothetical protein JTB14_018362 [Gonioctena quinquepunctata]|nr:hypothetical protein JTB14_018362 [Gonioctena quinquepunctata]
MKLMLWLLALSGYSITVHGSLNTIVANPGGIGGIYQGPDSETVIKGPDGSIITSQEKGGSIHSNSNLEPIIVAEPDISAHSGPSVSQVVPLVESSGVASVSLAPPLESIIPANIAPAAAPIIYSVNPAGEDHVLEIIEQDPHIIETEVVDAPIIEPQQSSDLVGPSGSISTRGSSSIVSGPASTTISEPARILIATPVVPVASLISPVTTGLHSIPYVEVNDEEPPRSVFTATQGADISLVSSTIAPLGVNTVSTSAPTIIRDSSTLGAELRNSGINIVSTLAPPIIRDSSTLGAELQNSGINIVSTLAPPMIRDSSTLGTELQNSGINIVSTLAPPIIRPFIETGSGNGINVVPTLAPPLGREYGGNIADLGNFGGYVGSTSAGQTARDQTPIVFSTTASPPAWTFDRNERIQPQLQVPTPPPIDRQSIEYNQVLVSTNSPAGFTGADRNVQPASFGRTQWIQPQVSTSFTTDGQLLNSNDVLVSTSSPIDGNRDVGIVQPASSYGVIDNWTTLNQVSSTPAPGVVYASAPSTDSVDIRPDANIQRINEAVANDRQLRVNYAEIPSRNIIPPEIGNIPPLSQVAVDRAATVHASANERQLRVNHAEIPSRNIIPPEIGNIPPLPQGTLDLGTTVQASSIPRAPGIVPTSNIQTINHIENRFVADGHSNIDGRLEGIPEQTVPSSGVEHDLQNEILVSDFGRELPGDVYQQSIGFVSNVPLLRDTNPINDRIGQRGSMGIQLGRASSEIQIPQDNIGPAEYDDMASASLWNRYGRRTRDGGW